MDNQVFSITFAERVENHKGMQIIGKEIETGLGENEFDNCINYCQKNQLKYELHDLTEHLSENEKKDIIKINGLLPFTQVLVIKNGIDGIMGEGSMAKLFEEQKSMPCDRKVWMRGRVVNKKARWNNCYADFDQAPDYENKKGTVISFDRVPLLNQLRDVLPDIYGERTKNLFAEMNYYYDLKNCYIGYHGDAERKIVICTRLGDDMPIFFRWHHGSEKVGSEVKIELMGGDIYCMSFKATGNDWRKRKIYTLRHAACLDENLLK